ncbi:MAG: hydrogenase maturation nickel metallochaperone HypA [Nitrospirae bacterium]|jgi:hydrogenase nickel incorporation protein HypA/HybF|nr:hydrogenase maturation nickel metallochaperone HypA [Nitrospirota bacterium]
MHEVGIAQSILDIAVNTCKNNGYKKVDSVKVRIGKAAGLLPDSLIFAFETMRIGTEAENATLIIEEVPVSGICNSCKEKFSVDDPYIIQCPNCGNISLRIDTGRELNVSEVEVS